MSLRKLFNRHKHNWTYMNYVPHCKRWVDNNNIDTSRNPMGTAEYRICNACPERQTSG